MFTGSARYYDALYRFKDYEAAVERLCEVLRSAHPSARSLLDVGCGTGRHLEHLRERYEVEGLDLNEDLLGLARERCPDVPFHRADMQSFSLERRFDVVTCLFSSIAYVKSVPAMQRSVASMVRHLKPGGVLVVEPWFTPETYWTGTITANHVDEADLKIAWMYTSEREDGVAVLDIHYLVGTPEEVEHFTERHELGLFTREQYEGAIRQEGLDVDFDPDGLFGRGLYVGRDRARGDGDPPADERAPGGSGRAASERDSP